MEAGARAREAEPGAVSGDGFSGGGGLQATMAVQFVERDKNHSAAKDLWKGGHGKQRFA